MATELKVLGILSVIYLITIFSTCRKGIICDPDPSYNFSISAKIYPDNDSISLNDTIVIDLKEPTLLTDQNSGSKIDFSKAANLGFAVAFGELLGDSKESDALNSFDLLIVKGIATGSSFDPDRSIEYLFTEENGYYVFKLEIIAKKKGIFRIGVSNANNVYTSENPCDKASFKITIKEANQHLYFNQWNYGVTPDLPNGVYCFKVYRSERKCIQRFTPLLVFTCLSFPFEYPYTNRRFRRFVDSWCWCFC